MSCLGIKSTDNNHWVNRAVLATVSVAAITLIVFSILAILSGCKLASLPATFSVGTLMTVGVAGGALFAILGLAIKFCCRNRAEGATASTLSSTDPKDTSEGSGQNGKKVVSVTTPDGKNSGAPGSKPVQDAFKVDHSEPRDPLR
ncbi:MAG TPA: hypothetical protein VIH61_09375, partial [Waddliaceae bacterium]